MVMDPTMMREKLYIDMLNSAGIPTQQGAWVRLFINNEPYGMYLMVDDIKKSFLKQTVHGGDGKIERGSLIQMNAWNENKATLEYKGDKTSDYNTKTNYIYQNLGNNPIDDPLEELIDLMRDLMRDLNSFNPTATRDPVQYWNDTRIDLEGILRNMALEYLVGAFDNYWLSASNYFMYKNPSMGPSGKWQWLLTDFDGTFGNGVPTSRAPSCRNWYDFRSEGDRPLVPKLIIENKEISGMFELISTAFKMQSLKPRIEMYNQMLSVDAKWNYSLTRKSPAINNNFTFEDFNNNLHTRARDMTTSRFGWLKSVSSLVASDLGFTIPATLEDRVPPPPKGKGQGSIDNDTAMMRRTTWTALPPRLATVVLVAFLEVPASRCLFCCRLPLLFSSLK